MKTISSVKSTVVKEDNGKRVFCKASNIRGKDVTSFINTLNVMCRYLKIQELNFFQNTLATYHITYVHVCNAKYIFLTLLIHFTLISKY